MVGAVVALPCTVEVYSDGELIGTAVVRNGGGAPVADVTFRSGLVLIDPDKTEASKQSWRGFINATREPSTEG